jgi:hypothetical protein
MKLGIMQPYFFPYIGYFQLLNAVDEFVVYDNIEFSKKGWVNRNRILVNGQDAYITLPLRKDSDYLDIVDRHLADVWTSERTKLAGRISAAYRKAPYYKEVFPLVEQCLAYNDSNLFRFIFHSIQVVKEYLGIETPLVVSSTIDIDHELKGAQRVLAICQARGADVYVNPIGGLELYDKEQFSQENISLFFLKANDIRYPQFGNEFIPYLSILDVLMFNSAGRVKDLLKEYTML